MKQNLPKILRQMGYAADTQGIINRFIRVNGAWSEHLACTRSFILETISSKRIRNLCVYGSGWLLDLPLKEIVQYADHIWLYDLIHPGQILHKISQYKNVTAVTADITGGSITAVYRWVQSHKKKYDKPDVEQICSRIFKPEVTPDFAISLNILSQIGDIVTDYLAKNHMVEPFEKEIIIRLLQEAHVRLLLSQPSCLITDVREELYNHQQELSETKPLIKCSLPEARKSRSWYWQFDPLGEYYPGFITRCAVVAMEL